MSSALSSAGAAIAAPHERSQASAVLAEELEAKTIADRRARMAERRDRLLDARTRTIGVDVEALDRQIREKEAAKAKEKEEELAYAAEQARMEVALRAYEASLTQKKLAERHQVKNSWKKQQVQKEGTIEYKELRDPAALRRERPARDGDTDSRLGASSMQVFDGEDRRMPERKALQAVQMKEWCLQMYSERAEAAALERQADQQYADYLRTVETMRQDADKRIAEEAAARRRAVAAENKRLAAESAARAAHEAEVDAKMGEHEVEGALSGGLLSEDPADGKSALGEARKRPDHYRGMSEEERAAVVAAQAAQAAEKAARKEEEKLAEMVEAAEQAKFLRAAAQIEAQQAAAAAAEKASYRHKLDKQKAEAVTRAEKDKAEAKGWYVTDNFFSAFGASDR